ncbi:hypothetical protein QQP08_019173, partial [Theobroma cacao]
KLKKKEKIESLIKKRKKKKKEKKRKERRKKRAVREQRRACFRLRLCSASRCIPTIINQGENMEWAWGNNSILIRTKPYVECLLRCIVHVTF